MSIHTGPHPDESLLAEYAARPGCHTDCYFADVAGTVTLAEYIAGFFATPVFRLERKILGLKRALRTTDADVARLANGQSTRFAAWEVEARDEQQVLLAVKNSPIRTWLMAIPTSSGGTRLYFGSAVLARETTGSDTPKLDPLVRGLMGFHRLYSRILLASAKRRVGSV